MGCRVRPGCWHSFFFSWFLFIIWSSDQEERRVHNLSAWNNLCTMAEVAVQFSSCYRHQSVRASKGGEITMLHARIDSRGWWTHTEHPATGMCQVSIYNWVRDLKWQAGTYLKKKLCVFPFIIHFWWWDILRSALSGCVVSLNNRT